MTPDEYEWQDEQMQAMADQVRNHAAESGRDVLEILQAMRDEGYIECSDAALERCAKMALKRPFYGAECPSYPNCSGGCGCGCTKEIERDRTST